MFNSKLSRRRFLFRTSAAAAEAAEAAAEVEAAAAAPAAAAAAPAEWISPIDAEARESLDNKYGPPERLAMARAWLEVRS